MKLLLIAYVASAAASERCQEQSHTHSPHLHKRDWHDGDRHCSYRESVVFESLSREFDRLVGPEPKATALITGVGALGHTTRLKMMKDAGWR